MTASADWRINITNRAEKSLRALSRIDQEAIAAAVERLPDGDTRKLKGRDSEFRLRVGSLRVVFHLERRTRTIEVREIFQRSRGY